MTGSRSRIRQKGLCGILSAAICLASLLGEPRGLAAQSTVDACLPRMAKVFGAGGLHRLESWQTATAISADGLFVTAWSYVLDSGAAIVLHDGRRFDAVLVGYDPRTELAVLKIDVTGQPHFLLEEGTAALPGQPVLAFSNLYGIAVGNEAVSVQRGIVSATGEVRTRRGLRAEGYNGPAVLVDAIVSNPGAAGGAVTDLNGKLVGLIGRESIDSAGGEWLNYAIPAERMRLAVAEILAGNARPGEMPAPLPSEPVTLDLLGLVLLPPVVPAAPAWIEHVLPGGAADVAGLRVDDLIVAINGVPVATHARVLEQLAHIDRDDPFTVTVQRQVQFVELAVDLNR